MLEHSEAKVRLLGAYLKAYLGVMANDGYTERIRFYDFFCGEGIYPNGKEGSPVLMARQLAAVNAARSNKRTPELHLTYNDDDPAKVERVRQHLLKVEIAGLDAVRLHPTNVSFEAALSEVLAGISRAGKEKFFFFLDPYGYKDVKPSQIRDLMKGGRSEVLLFQPSQFLFRFSEKGTPSALAHFMSELASGEDWPQGGSTWDYIRHTTSLFARYLGQSCFVDAFTIQKDASTVFCLFFFTPHIRGFEKMLEAKWKIDSDSGRGWHYEDSQVGFELFNQPQTNPLERLLESQFHNAGFVSNGELYEWTLRQGFLPTHCRDILLAWQKAGRLKVDPEDTRKGAFYLNYSDFKNGPGKIRISLVM